ncbi:DinB family protein [Marinicrinis sediminis]|uniref:DinB family protein n=1 Tax=Marinicrinis sediminis TaxID=1652465 RepID=A0ABW5R9N8_9BACL
MIEMMRYNWRIRESYFELCSSLPREELVKERNGGAGSILKTFFHIVEMEHSWMQELLGRPDRPLCYEDNQTLENIMEMSRESRIGSEWIFQHSNSYLDGKLVDVSWLDEKIYYGEILRHVIVHEIHHMGQLSVWVREMGLKPVCANFIQKGLMEIV